MEISVTEGAGYLLVRARGTLSLRTVADLRDALLKASAEQPRGIVCDLREVHASRESLTILHVVADQIADWPATPLALVANGRAMLVQLERLGLRRRLPVVADLDHAASALRWSPRLLVSAIELPATPDAPARARAFVGDALTRWGAGPVAEGARWVTSELVTNAVVHARTVLGVRVSLIGRRASVAVSDRGRGGPVTAGDEGWGLRVVEQLSRSWGVLPRLGEGSVVYAVLDVDVPPSMTLPHQTERRA